LTNCSKKHAPWYVIPSNHKWFRNLTVSSIIADAIDDMKLKLPKPTVDLADIRKLYHADAKGSAKKAGGKKPDKKSRKS
jgi:sulfur relay (sulfurtransferase) DsrC/TusE family protein